MDTDDLEPRTKKPQPKDLSILGVSQLQEYISELKAEVARAEQEIAKREKHKSGAEALFKK